MLEKKVWIPILIILLAVGGCSLFYSQKTAKQETITIINPVGFERPTAPKTPPPEETRETGHWHGDVWHSEPHEPVEVSKAESEFPTTPPERIEVQGEPVGVQEVGAQPPGPMQVSSRTRTSQEVAEIQRQWREWSKWTKKAQELRVKFSQVSQLNTDLMPKTAEEAERYQTDKEWQRKVQEATDKYDEVLGMMQEHEANRVLPSPQSYRQ